MNRKRTFSAALLLAAAIPVLIGTTGASALEPLILTCDGYVATIYGTAGDDFLVGTNGVDVIIGRGGHDTIHGRGGNDRICGNAGNDRIYGGAPNNLYIADGNDRLFGNEHTDRLYGGNQNDFLHAQDGLPSEVVDGQSGTDYCTWDNADFVYSCLANVP